MLPVCPVILASIASFDAFDFAVRHRLGMAHRMTADFVALVHQSLVGAPVRSPVDDGQKLAL